MFFIRVFVRSTVILVETKQILMKKETLYRFFDGTATFYEEQQVKEWVEQTDDNLTTLLKARKEFDTILLAGNKASLSKRYSASRAWIIGLSAAVVAILTISVIYLFFNQEQSENYNTLIVPPGQRINLILSDNTNLWLNANTKLRYPTEFSKDNRTVFLDGEAYFEVSEDHSNPFIVKTAQGDVRVTGTTFNVEAYSQYNSFNTSLFEGGVDIYRDEEKLITLLPNQKSTCQNNQLVISKIEDSDIYLWREGLIAFKNKELEEILNTLEKYFNVEIQISATNLPKHTYTGKFRQSDGVGYALRVLQRSIRFTYDRNEETGVIYVK